MCHLAVAGTRNHYVHGLFSTTLDGISFRRRGHLRERRRRETLFFSSLLCTVGVDFDRAGDFFLPKAFICSCSPVRLKVRNPGRVSTGLHHVCCYIRPPSVSAACPIYIAVGGRSKSRGTTSNLKPLLSCSNLMSSSIGSK